MESAIARDGTYIWICFDSVVCVRDCLWIGGHDVSARKQIRSLRGGNAITPAWKGINVNDRAVLERGLTPEG